MSYSFSGQTTYAKLIDKDTLLENILIKINKYIGANFNTVLLNFYRDGDDYICSHIDDEYDLDTTKGIWSLSIGGARTFNITDKNTNDKIIDVNLEDGMIGCFQKQFKHGIKNYSKRDTT